MRDVTIRELLDSIRLETGVDHVLHVHFPKLRVRLPIDPAQATSWDDRFVLTTTYKDKATTQVQTVKDDLVPDDAYRAESPGDIAELCYRSRAWIHGNTSRIEGRHAPKNR